MVASFAPKKQERFLAILRGHDIVTTLRPRKGHDIEAACGQLRLQTKRSEESAVGVRRAGPRRRAQIVAYFLLLKRLVSSAETTSSRTSSGSFATCHARSGGD